MSAELQDFFRHCASDGTRSIDQEAFRDLCDRLNISASDADLIFGDLDADKDGKISFTDFSKGFSNFISESNGANIIHDRVFQQEDRAENEDMIKNSIWTTLATEAEKVGHKTSDEGKLKWLLNELQTTEQRHLVPLLEGAVEELLNSLRQLQEEKSRLEESWQREKAEHQKHLKRMEEELDSQVKEVEMRLRLKAQEDVEDERKVLQLKMDSELHKLAVIEKVFSWFRTQQSPEQPRDPRLDEVRTKLNEAVYDNHQLRMSLLDTQTSIALMRSELLQLRALYEEKCRELSSEKEKILEVLQEQDQLSMQLSLLQETNRRLLDSHDALRNSMLDCSNKQFLGGTPRKKSGSIIGDYLNLSKECLDRFPEQQEEEEDEEEMNDVHLRRAESMDITSFPVKKRTRTKSKDTARQSLNQSDSGVSTVRDSFGPDDTWEDEFSQRTPPPADGQDTDDEEIQPTRSSSGHHRRDSRRNSSVPPPEDRRLSRSSTRETLLKRPLRPSTSEDSLLEASEMLPTVVPRRRISEIKKQLGIEESPGSWRRSWASNQCSTPLNSTQQRHLSPPVPLPRLSKGVPEYRPKNETSSIFASSVEVDESEFEPDGAAEQTFKLIFVGDAGVGKSSFALRISKGVFVRHMTSTLGLDFLMRTIRVDGRNVAVQLWDTAGQERFRSITKSYFRKADGVMLLYDCTCEHSYLNIRQWVEDINREAFQRIPLMIVANKIDLRDAAIRSGKTCVTTEQGHRLAKDCDTIFMEASAKDGSNVLPALASLIRAMSSNQDLQITASTVQLSDDKQKKKGSCCSSGNK